MVRVFHENLLEVKCQVSGDDADVKHVLYVLKLTLLEVAEDVQGLRGDGQEWSKVCVALFALIFS